MKNFKISIFTFFITSLFTAFALSGAVAQSKPTPVPDEEKKPLKITSERMKTEDNGRKITFMGNVHGTWGDVVLKSEVLEIYTRPSTEKEKGNAKKSSTQGAFGEGQELDKIIAIKNVDITKGDQKAKGDKAVYFDKDQKMILTGKPYATAWDDKNQIQGSEMYYFLNEERFEVTKGVTLILFPKKKDSPKEK